MKTPFKNIENPRRRSSFCVLKCSKKLVLRYGRVFVILTVKWLRRSHFITNWPLHWICDVSYHYLSYRKAEGICHGNLLRQHLIRSDHSSDKKSPIDDTTAGWITNMVSNRYVNIELKDNTIRIKIKRGCPQGGILSPFLWNLVVDDLLRLSVKDVPGYLQAFADDLITLVKGQLDPHGV